MQNYNNDSLNLNIFLESCIIPNCGVLLLFSLCFSALCIIILLILFRYYIKTKNKSSNITALLKLKPLLLDRVKEIIENVQNNSYFSTEASESVNNIQEKAEIIIKQAVVVNDLDNNFMKNNQLISVRDLPGVIIPKTFYKIS